tara:strand:+ start:69 stop:1391 length:1323 start_codon:yes stop_codon:yes gene_type:complete
MAKKIQINKKINIYKKKIEVSGDKSLSIRWVLFSSLADGISKSKNLLISEDVMASIKAIRKLGIKIIFRKNICHIHGKGIDGYRYKKNLLINAENSGTFGRLILGLLVNTTHPIKLIGDQSLSKRDFKRVTEPLSKFGSKFKLYKNKYLPLTIYGNNNLKGIRFYEKIGSAQCKSSVIFAGLRAKGTTFIKAKKSRDHTELLCKHLKLPVQIRRKKNFDEIKVKKVKTIKPLNYNIPSDISSAAFFLVLTALNIGSELTIKNVNINPSRIGVITILKKMGIKIKLKNIKIYKNEKIANIHVKGTNKIKPINCPTNLNSGAIDEFLIIFLIAAKANGVSYFKNIEELNKKESPRLKWGAKILNLMGIKTLTTNSSIKIFGNPDLKINKKIIIKNFLKDHRIFMTSTIAALSFGGKWSIHDKDSINTSFPDFLKIINDLKKK